MCCSRNSEQSTCQLAQASFSSLSNGACTVCCCCSVPMSCLTLCDPMDCSTPGFPVHQQLPDFTQTHVYQASDAIQLSHSLSSFPWGQLQGRGLAPCNSTLCPWSPILFSSVAQLCPTLCNPMDRSTPGFPVHHQLPGFIQTHVH